MLKLKGGRWYVGRTALTDNEATILFAVMGRPRVTIRDLVEMIYPDPDDEPAGPWNCIRHFVMTLRRKIAPTGWSVVGSSGVPFGAPTHGFRLVRLDDIEQRIAA